jgi:uncharacterized membrane protein YtjA (UPF0391 family)
MAAVFGHDQSFGAQHFWGSSFSGNGGTNSGEPRFYRTIRRRWIMLYWALVFFVVAIIAGALGFGGIAGTSTGIAQILFFIFLAFLVISLIAGLFRRA